MILISTSRNFNNFFRIHLFKFLGLETFSSHLFYVNLYYFKVSGSQRVRNDTSAWPDAGTNQRGSLRFYSDSFNGSNAKKQFWPDFQKIFSQIDWKLFIYAFNIIIKYFLHEYNVHFKFIKTRIYLATAWRELKLDKFTLQCVEYF